MGVKTKKELVKAEIVKKHGCKGAGCSRCAKLHSFIDKMEDSNIPIGYWLLSMKDFKGSPGLKDIYEDYSKDIKSKYVAGDSICFSGNQGTGKTMTSISILRSALKNGLTAYYITAIDILNDMTNFKTSHILRGYLRDADFLVIDELDSRFFSSDSTKELFSGIYENIFRFRTSNELPTIICTNETEGILDVFRGPSVQSINSLNHQYLTIHPVVGKDFRRVK